MSNLGVEEEKGDEKVKINPYNVNNKLICEEDIYRGQGGSVQNVGGIYT